MRTINEQKERINRIKKDSKTSRLSRFHSKMIKNEIKYKRKEIQDVNTIAELLVNLQDGDNIYIFSNVFDSPYIIQYFADKHVIEEILISTWAITDRGLNSIKKLSEKGIKVKLLLDATYSYKWIFSSGASEYLQNVEFKFTANHSKMILIKTDNLHISVLGSMNLSNNPRFENINFVVDVDIYEFYKQELNRFFKTEKNGTYKQGSLFKGSEITTTVD